ncbi:MAG: PIG-L family deacetylase [Chloroflexota bacterium]
MNAFYDIIVLSPHLDDAALSCGGFLYSSTQQGKTALVVTLMSGEPPKGPFSAFASRMHARWDLAAQIVAQRKQEDIEACQVLGTDYYHATIPDAIYRFDQATGSHFYTSNELLFGKINLKDAELVIEKLFKIIQALPKHAQLLAPLTVGNHVDHQLVRTAVEQGYSGQVIYYEDYPYARESNAVDTVIANDRFKLEHHNIALTNKQLEIKGESIAKFKSQISSFFNDRSDIDTKLKAYASRVGGERQWTKP